MLEQEIKAKEKEVSIHYIIISFIIDFVMD
jgi:hypothetical protein